MGLSGIYNSPVPHEDGVALVKAAFGAGVTFFDTADAYGPHTNEVLLGKVGNFFSFPLYLIPSAGAILLIHLVGDGWILLQGFEFGCRSKESIEL
jgi:hypothetical protein